MSEILDNLPTQAEIDARLAEIDVERKALMALRKLLAKQQGPAGGDSEGEG